MRLLEIYKRYLSIKSNQNLSLNEKIKIKNKLFMKIGRE